jgi:outer membrane protein, heavy metal efflux system
LASRDLRRVRSSRFPALPRFALFTLTFSVSAVLVPGCATPAQIAQAVPVTAAASSEALGARSLDAPELRQFLIDNLGAMPRQWDFEGLSWVAFYYHPTLDVARAEWAAKRAARVTAAARPNPSLTLIPGVSANAPAGVSPWFSGVNLDFLLETRGKRDRRIAAAEFAAEISRLTVLAAAWQVRSELRHALIEYKAANIRLPLVRAQRDAQHELAGRLEQRRAAGAGTGVEVANARLAEMRSEEAVASTEAQVALARGRVARALGISTAMLAPAPLASIEMADMSPPTVTRTLRDTALQTRSDVLTALARLAAADATLELELRRRHPDVHLAPGYQWDQGESKWSIGVTLELPFFNRNEGPIGEAVAARNAAAAQLSAIQVEIIAAIDEATTAASLAEARVTRARQLQAASSEQAARIRQRYTAGVIDRLEALAAEIEQQAAAASRLEAESALALARGQVEDALQVPFDRMDRLAPPPASPSPTSLHE